MKHVRLAHQDRPDRSWAQGRGSTPPAFARCSMRCWEPTGWSCGCGTGSACELRSWAALTRGTGGDRLKHGGVDSVSVVDHRIWACCNHVSYAARSVLLELQNPCTKIQASSRITLAPSSRNIRSLLKCEDVRSRRVAWQQLFKKGAPKALGDVFLAVLGAITMDSGYFEAEQLMLEHYQDSEELFQLMKNRGLPAGIPVHDIMSTNGLRQLGKLSTGPVRDVPRGGNSTAAFIVTGAGTKS